MTTWKELLTVLHDEIGLPNKVGSNSKVMQQGFDNRTQEHVVWLEYRSRVRHLPEPKANPQLAKTYKERTFTAVESKGGPK